jgi:hypothetical protein
MAFYCDVVSRYLLKIRMNSLRFAAPKCEFWSSQRRSMVVNYSIPTLYGLLMFPRSLMMLLMMMIYKMITFRSDDGSCEDKLVHDVIRCECHRVWWWRECSFNLRVSSVSEEQRRVPGLRILRLRFSAVRCEDRKTSLYRWYANQSHKETSLYRWYANQSHKVSAWVCANESRPDIEGSWHVSWIRESQS